MPDPGDRSFSNVLENIVGNVQEIIRAEVRLAKAEVREEAAKAGRASVILGAGAVLALYALGFFFLAALFALEMTLAPWLAAIILTVAIGIAASLLIAMGVKRMKHVHPRPEKTIHSIQENLEWAKHQTR